MSSGLFGLFAAIFFLFFSSLLFLVGWLGVSAMLAVEAVHLNYTNLRSHLMDSKIV